MTKKLLPALAAGMLVLAGCGAQAGSKDERPPRFAAAPSPLQPVAGCGERADFALVDDPKRGPTRCEAGSPAPVRLEKRRTITLAMSSKSAEFVAPLVMAESLGEFERENLDVEISILPPADSIQLLADGRVDAVAASSSAAFYNALSQGFDIRLALGQGWSSRESGAGIWAAGDGVKVEDLKGKRIGSAVGVGSAANLAFADKLHAAGLSVNDVSFESIDVADAATALSNGSIDAAMMLDPFWVPMKGSDDYTFLASDTEPGGSNGGVYFGPSLSEDRPAALALTRAYVRTINTHLAGDYKADPDALKAEAKAMGVTVDQLRDTPSYHFNWDFPPGVTRRHQAMYEEAHVLQYTEPIPERRIVDRSFVAEAVGLPRP
ncbi:ABC transporter substrate-binding protein [Streptomyces sulphureus]|uniref:ABC transporter substrate-binding protein n=1 Tax=Streptomyces sulphureus TaxID=47758 RepID=UPI00036B644D|nr:ABC transporter substrate-binding protein [Streptomyces sulphureus]